MLFKRTAPISRIVTLHASPLPDRDMVGEKCAGVLLAIEGPSFG